MANFTVAVSDASGQTANASGVITTTGGAQVPINVGETAILQSVDSGNAGFLIAQKVTLSTPGVPQSLSFYVEAVSGNLRLGLYRADGASGTPGNLVAQTASFVPVAGWNTKALAGNLVAGDYWLVYTPSANGLSFRLGGGGNLRHVARTFQAMPATFPSPQLTNWDGSHFSFYMTVLVDQATIPPPPIPTGLITEFNGTAANWQDASLIDGKEWFNHHGGRAYSLTKLDDYTLRMEIRQGDPEAIDVGGERSEINSGFSYPSGQLIDVEFMFTMEAGATLDSPKPAWFSLLQIYGEVGTTAVRPASINMDGEKMGLDINFDAGTFATLWRDPSPIVRGREYKMHLQITTGTNGIVKLWRDDVLLVNHAGNVPGTNNFIKLGIYRGWNGLVPQTSAAKYSRIKAF